LNIGFVSTWFERGAAYVTKQYVEALKEKNEIFIYARGGERYEKNDEKWNLTNVTWGLRLGSTNINYKHFKSWINSNKIQVVFFNEQHEIDVILKMKSEFPQIKIGTYVDYYKEDSIDSFWLYDFLICNTKRHYSVFKDHPQAYYVPWGTDIELFSPKPKIDKELVFFHSVGMSKRKGTELVIKAFIDGGLYNESKLVIHSQLDFHKAFGYKIDELKAYNIHVVEKTVTAPGLYHLGDVYVYPTKLDGLGLTVYEALSCGLPVITTDVAPMNEVVNTNVGKLVDVDNIYSRSDGYYWPLSICSKVSLIACMKSYIDNTDKVDIYKVNAREYAVEKFNWKDRYQEVNKIFENTKTLDININLSSIEEKIKKKSRIETYNFFIQKLPDRLVDLLNKLLNR